MKTNEQAVSWNIQGPKGEPGAVTLPDGRCWANRFTIAGGMLGVPGGPVLLIGHPRGAKSFDYGDRWDGADLIYTGRGQEGDQRFEGPNGDVAENRRAIEVFEGAGRSGRARSLGHTV